MLLLLLLRTRASFSVLLCFMHLLLFQMFFCVIFFFLIFISGVQCNIYTNTYVLRRVDTKSSCFRSGIVYIFLTPIREILAGDETCLELIVKIGFFRRFFSKGCEILSRLFDIFKEHWRLLRKNRFWDRNSLAGTRSRSEGIRKLVHLVFSISKSRNYFGQIFYDTSICSASSICH